MSPRKLWERRVIGLLERLDIIGRAKTREELLRVRSLVERAAEIIDADDELSDSAVKIREALALIDAELSKVDADFGDGV